MRNYYRTLKIEPDTELSSLERNIRTLAEEEPGLAEKASDIILNPVRKAVYDNLHLQYAAIARAHQVFSKEGMLDTNDWHLRLVEFYDDSDDSTPLKKNSDGGQNADSTLELFD